MSQIDELRALTVAMYQHTSAAVRASQCVARSQSETFIKRAPVQKLAPAEQQERLSRVLRDVSETILIGPLPASLVREQLSSWKGAKVR